MVRRIILPYAPSLKKRALELRNQSTPSENQLWQSLKGKYNGIYDFHRQKPLLYWIADFYCVELRLVIELDGSVHNDPVQREKDKIKERELNAVGINILRFSNNDVLQHSDAVLSIITTYIKCFELKEWIFFDDDVRFLNPLACNRAELVLKQGINVE
ncbi:MAG: DUF559 domain-containing protein [Ignavibacteria bacterium]|nr:DUF559 domain-containing protein [Ignavibacteria bacterium]